MDILVFNMQCDEAEEVYEKGFKEVRLQSLEVVWRLNKVCKKVKL